MKNKKIFHFIIALALVLVLVGVDQLTKYIANTNEALLNGEELPFIKYIISFKLAYNTGAAFSILTGQRWLLVTLSIIASIGGVYAIYKFADFKKNVLLTITLVLIVGGAMGNFIDRMFFEQGVIDFLNFEFIEFPIFNFADTCLTIGAGLLIVYMIFFYEEPKKKTIQSGEEDA